MRKILLGTTAVLGAAVLAPMPVHAQEAPTVRIGGFFQAYFGNTIQTGMNATNVSMNQISQDGNSAGFGTIPGNQSNSARQGHNDFSTQTEVHVFVSGKAANGMAYGAVIELNFDSAEGTDRPGGRRSTQPKTGAAIDEMYAFVSTPTLGQLRIGDEDGPMGGLMNVGWITNFGTGGVYGYWESFTVRPNRTTTSPGGLGDNTKIIYLSPQVFGFDLGLSYAFNEGEGEDVGCLNSFSSVQCDRAYAITNNQGAFNNREGAARGRLNELQAMLRWRGSIAGVGLAAGFGTMQSGQVRNIDVNGNIFRNLRSPSVYQAGLQASYMGFTVGGNYMWGNTTFFYIPTQRGAQNMGQWVVGGSYTLGPLTVGANTFWGHYAPAAGLVGTAPPGVDPGSVPGVAPPNTGPSQRRSAWSIGANYRLAPGLDLVAEYTMHQTRRPGFSQQGLGACSATNINNCSDRAIAQVFLTGIRLAF